MKKIAGISLSFILSYLFLLSSGLRAQPGTYILNGSATQDDCHCYTLTQAVNTQGGSVWNANKISLSNPFSFTFSVFLGCSDANGADGIVFILQPISTSIGNSGGGMGFQGIVPSVGIPLDTWQNTDMNDPAYDHISIQLNGNTNHNSDPVPNMPISSTTNNVEDCNWHELRISWEPATQRLATWFDGVPRVEATIDLVNTVFAGDPNVFWGFSGATGGSNNLQRFCTALTPRFSTNFTGNGVCAGTPVFFQNTSTAFGAIVNQYWDFGDGTSTTAYDPPPHVYNTPGVYEVKLVITGQDGCLSDTLRRSIIIGDKPVVSFEAFDTCFKQTPRIIPSTSVQFGTPASWSWIIDGGTPVNTQLPSLSNLPVGTHTIQYTATSDIGCVSDPANGTVRVLPLPSATINAQDICAGDDLAFTYTQTDNQTTISGWNWTFDEGGNSTQAAPVQSFSRPGNHTVSLIVTASNGCVSEPAQQSFLVNVVNVKAPNDTIVLPNQPFTLNGVATQNGSQPLSYNWSPATGLGNAGSLQTSGSVADDITYVLTATSAEGCADSDTVKIKVFKGSAVYVPSGFTPNADGKNDLLKPLYVGIRRLDYFMVYNRWGQEVFRTTDMSKGWDGFINGKPQDNGVYVWVVKAEDVVGNVIAQKGTAVIIR